MKILMKILKLILLTLLVVLLIPVIEAGIDQEIPFFKSAGNCRVVNTRLAYELKDAKLIFYTTVGKGKIIVKNNTYIARKTDSNVHVVTFDNNGTHHDLSDSFKSLSPEKKKDISDMNYTVYKKSYIHNNDLISNKLKNSNIVFSEVRINTESFFYMYYVYVFLATKRLETNIKIFYITIKGNRCI